MLLKKPSKKDPADNTSLDAAMSELTRQTEALLGKAETPQRKPILPKKHSRPQAKGRSFDIIQSGKRARPLRAVLKAVPSKPSSAVHSVATQTSPVVGEHDPDELLLPAHSSSAVVITHSGRLADIAPQETELRENKTETEPVGANASFSSTKPKTVSFEDEATEPIKPSAENTEATETPDVKELDSKPEPLSEAETTDTPRPPSYTSGELYTNNSVGPAQLSGYTPPKDQLAPPVFDTDEYHATLHDWSKLENHGHSKWLFLLLLVVIAAATLYFIISGQKLPF